MRRLAEGRCYICGASVGEVSLSSWSRFEPQTCCPEHYQALIWLVGCAPDDQRDEVLDELDRLDEVNS